MIKKILLSIIATIFLTVFTLLVCIFLKPTLIINPDNINWALKKSQVLEEWSWTNAEIKIDWIKYNERHLKGVFEDLCIKYKSESADVDTCVEYTAWDFDLAYLWGRGFRYYVRETFTIQSNHLNVTLHETAPLPEKEEAPFIPPDIREYWSMLWTSLFPDIGVAFKKIDIKRPNEDNLVFDFYLYKNGGTINVKTFELNLVGTKESIEISGPENFKIPVDIKTNTPLDLTSINLKLKMNENPIPVSLTSGLKKIGITASTKLKFPMDEHFLRDILLGTEVRVSIPKINEALGIYMLPPFNILPAPLNSLEGNVDTYVNFSLKNEVVAHVYTEVNLNGEKQFILFNLNVDAPLDIKTFELGAINIGLEIQRISLLLPRLSKTSVPPQLTPDSRIQVAPPKKEELKNSIEKKSLSYSLNLEASGEDTLSISTNLLDEPARLNFNLIVTEEGISHGHVKLLPLRTSIFKRPIVVEDLIVEFKAPEVPELRSTVLFKLPQYEIRLKLDGPVNGPRYVFTSDPLLPLDDIYAVLLFGRPLMDLNVDDRNSAGQTNKILGQGLLSLSVLYFLAGSPVESLGYDPESNQISAQIGLDDKSSIRVTGQDGDFSSAGVRRSLGKGWYLDTTVQKTNTSSNNSYGVLLERIIAY